MAYKLKGEELHEFTEGLAILLEADIPLDYALESMVSVVESPKVKELCRGLVARVREGSGLSQALAASKSGFTEAYLGMVRVGEMGGQLPQVLDHLGRMLARNQELKRGLAQAVFYPGILLVASLLAVGFILVYVLPAFVTVFQDMHLELPPAAGVLVAVGEWMDRYAVLLMVFLLVVAVLTALALRSPANRLVISRGMLKAGPLGRIMSSWQATLFCRSLGFMLTSGVPIGEATRFAAQAVSSPAFRESLAEVESGLKEGASLVAVLAASKHFPPVVLRMVALGERTGRLAAMLMKVADLLESRVKYAMSRMLVFTEPAIILFMGLIVGFVVVTMLTTIFALTQGGM